MPTTDLMEMLKGLASGLAALLGSHTEVALHDLRLHQIVFIEHSYITGRDVGYNGDELMYHSILELAKDSDQLIGYKSSSPSGKALRSSHFIFRDEEGTPCALLCVNQDISFPLEILAFLQEQFSFHSIQEDDAPSPSDGNYIQKTMRQVILNSIEKLKPLSLDSKEGKLEVIRMLEYQGVFSVKDSVPQVCEMLSISQATLYNYLRELRIKKF
ncbi:PAS domain-containing protein [Anaerotignum lactatifermentans]|uniref:PAS domain-containing protein n=1 Tax=Anaerotignum lactatifermentans TaxID=160404 RepID=A0ABS2GA61_9FIRM|nr:PAS domain-containing protein [Anaerotignum lactatifermentans]MBM6829360.1 PAS domain-containing protein [Anaerotignum lactatifermentans]MBM6877399.1 PAS domain-containing protein [Anaerotignum lactatifermentans]MBM6950937.1 PAS domain-containing protein [Anaerotignum lactatifermentans]